MVTDWQLSFLTNSRSQFHVQTEEARVELIYESKHLLLMYRLRLKQNRIQTATTRKVLFIANKSLKIKIKFRKTLAIFNNVMHDNWVKKQI